MLNGNQAFSGFSVTDLDAARTFYGDTLGLSVTNAAMGFLTLEVGDGNGVLVYPSDTHRPASYTVLNFPVGDIDAAVDWLTSRGVTIERYEGFDHDARGISRGMGPDIAWFTDPSGNVLSVMSEG